VCLPPNSKKTVVEEVNMGEERRRFPRLPISVDIGAKHSNLPLIKAKTLDISVGGIRLFLPRQLLKGNVMELKMNLPFPLVIARGKVAWTKEVETEEGKSFQTGIELSDGFISANYTKMKGFVHNIIRASKT
jgi:hypothetical protein